MEAFFYIAGGVAILGGIVGWFSRGNLFVALPICVFISFAVLACMLLVSSNSEHITWQNLPEALLYWIEPFLLFLFAPCCVGGIVMTIVAHVTRRRPERPKDRYV